MSDERTLKLITLGVGTAVKVAILVSCIQSNVPAAIFWFFLEWRLDTVMRFPTE
jgi:hypothetical protein